MANELTYSLSVTATKNGATVTTSLSKTKDMSGNEMSSIVQTLSTSPAAVQIGGCDSLESITIKNLSETTGENVTVGLDNPITQVMAVIKPGGGIMLEGAPTTLYAKSATGTPDIFIVAVET